MIADCFLNLGSDSASGRKLRATYRTLTITSTFNRARSFSLAVKSSEEIETASEPRIGAAATGIER
jgi:hypothetical protein